MATEVLARRARDLPAPPSVVFGSLTEWDDPAARPWLTLLDDEVPPRVLASTPDTEVVWSSLWPSRPDDEIHLALASDAGAGTKLTFELRCAEPFPDESKLGHLRYRLNHLFFADLRLSYGQ